MKQMHYNMAVTIASINFGLNRQNGRSDVWEGTQVELIADVYGRDIEQVKQDVIRDLEERVQEDAEVLSVI